MLSEEKERLYPSNSKKERTMASVDKKPEKPTIERVTTGKVIKQKKGVFKRTIESFLGNETRSVGEYILHDVIFLAAKRMVCDMVGWGGAAEMILFGDKAGRGGRGRDRDRAHTSYGSYYKDTGRDRDRDRNDRRDISREARSRHDFDEVIFETRGDAERVLFDLADLIKDYGQATVRDFYDFAGIRSEHTDENYGWVDMRGVIVRPTRNGYVIDLPRTKVLD